MRRTGRIAAAVGLSLACSYAAVASTTPPGDGWLITTLPVAPHAASSFSEPGIAVGPHGVLIANACTANAGGPSTFWLSRNDGRSWSTGFPVGTSAIGCGDSDAVVGSDGYLYSLTLGTGVDVYRSRDGVHWDGPATFPPPHGEDQPDRPWLVTLPHHPATVLMFNSEGGGNVVEWRSTDHAQSFTGPIPVTASGLNSEAGLMLGSRPIVAPDVLHPRDDRHLFMVYETVGGAGLEQSADASGPAEFPLSRLYAAFSDDAGRSWSNSAVLDLPKAFGVQSGSLGHLLPAVAVDPAGRAYVVLSVRLGSSTETHLYLLHNLAGGAAWSPPVRIDRGLPSNVFPAIAVSSPGHLVVSWYGSSASDFNDPGAHWFEEYAATSDALARHPRFIQRRLGDDVPDHVGPIDNMGAVGNDLGQNWGLRDFQSILVDACGHPHVIWARDYRGARTFTATTTPVCDASRLTAS